jgi:uncharacterized membrane protein
MPYCNQCGTQSGDADRFCAKCGAAQPVAGVPPPHPDFLNGVPPRTAALLCYIPVVGWIWAIIVLASTRYRTNAQLRFNAFQGLYLFVTWLIVDWVVGPMFMIPLPHEMGVHFVPKLLKLALMGAWIFMIIKTSQGENYRLPILGELADRSVSEQR